MPENWNWQTFIQITMPVLETAIVATAASYVGDLISQGALREVGKNIWNKLSSNFKTEKEKQLLLELKERPQDQELRGRIAGRLEMKLEEDDALRQEYEKLSASISEVDQKQIIQVINSPGSVVGSNISAGGNVEIKGNIPKEN